VHIVLPRLAGCGAPNLTVQVDSVVAASVQCTAETSAAVAVSIK